ncbi:MAG: hypothetical protein ABIP55_05185 [Tepidisphaeraceae bacterium]
MRLLVNGDTLPIRQMGDDFLLVDRPVCHPPMTATVVLRVDDSEKRWQVRLPQGNSRDSERVQIESVD